MDRLVIGARVRVLHRGIHRIGTIVHTPGITSWYIYVVRLDPPPDAGLASDGPDGTNLEIIYE